METCSADGTAWEARPGACPGSANGTPTCVANGDSATCGVRCNASFCVHPDMPVCVESATSTSACGASCMRCPGNPNGTAECLNGQCRLMCRRGFSGPACAASPEWEQLAPLAAPGPSFPPPGIVDTHAVYDPASNSFVVLPVPSNGQVWILENASGQDAAGRDVAPRWVEVRAAGPFPMLDGRIAYSPTGRLMLFASDYDSSMEHWVAAGVRGAGMAQWGLAAPTPAPGTAPSGRLPSTASVVYDAARNQIVFFGGTSRAPGYHDETFVRTNADGTGGTPQWTRLAPASPPSNRVYFAAVMDAARDRMVIYGGSSSLAACCVNVVEVLRNVNNPALASWTQAGPGPASGGRTFASMALDPDNERLIVFGGTIGDEQATSYTNEVWTFGLTTGTAAVLAPAGTPPAPRRSSAAGFDRRSRRFMILGGVGASSNELWVLHSASR